MFAFFPEKKETHKQIWPPPVPRTIPKSCLCWLVFSPPITKHWKDTFWGSTDGGTHLDIPAYHKYLLSPKKRDIFQPWTSPTTSGHAEMVILSSGEGFGLSCKHNLRQSEKKLCRESLLRTLLLSQINLLLRRPFSSENPSKSNLLQDPWCVLHLEPPGKATLHVSFWAWPAFAIPYSTAVVTNRLDSYSGFFGVLHPFFNLCLWCWELGAPNIVIAITGDSLLQMTPHPRIAVGTTCVPKATHVNHNRKQRFIANRHHKAFMGPCVNQPRLKFPHARTEDSSSTKVWFFRVGIPSGFLNHMQTRDPLHVHGIADHKTKEATSRPLSWIAPQGQRASRKWFVPPRSPLFSRRRAEQARRSKIHWWHSLPWASDWMTTCDSHSAMCSWHYLWQGGWHTPCPATQTLWLPHLWALDEGFWRGSKNIPTVHDVNFRARVQINLEGLCSRMFDESEGQECRVGSVVVRSAFGASQDFAPNLSKLFRLSNPDVLVMLLARGEETVKQLVLFRTIICLINRHCSCVTAQTLMTVHMP